MSIFADYRGLPESARGASIALGNFDGLHAGHKAVIAAAREAGEGYQLDTVVDQYRLK